MCHVNFDQSVNYFKCFPPTVFANIQNLEHVMVRSFSEMCGFWSIYVALNSYYFAELNQKVTATAKILFSKIIFIHTVLLIWFVFVHIEGCYNWLNEFHQQTYILSENVW